MNDTIPFKRNVPADLPFAFSMDTLMERLSQVTDLRKRRGVRYALPMLLSVAVLARLCGQTRLEPLAHWAHLRARELAHLFGVARTTMPHQHTWSRILGDAVAIDSLETLLHDFFSEQLTTREIPERGSVVLAIDGKPVRGTIPAGQTRGVHLVAAYVPEQGVVLAQRAVDHKANEIVAMPKLLAQLDLTGMGVVGDAMQAQREVRMQVVKAGGDYLWFVQENQPTLLADLELLCTHPHLARGWSDPTTDCVTARTVEKGHGRIEQRLLTVSRMLREYVDWPHLDQVFR